MIQGESIYNIIQPEYVPQKQQLNYKSKYPPKIPPTYSTFCNKTTSRPKVANIRGDFDLDQRAHTNMGQTNTFGRKKDEVKPNPSNYLRKRANSAQKTDSNFQYIDRQKPDVPRVNEKPLMGLQSNKNFVILNAVENILSEPKKMEEKINYITKKEYGKVPKYLQNIKSNINGEYDMIQTMNNQQRELQEQQRQIYNSRVLLSEQEVAELRNGLKARWQEQNKKYQQLTHKFIDTTGLKRNKEECEKELKQIEKDIEKLSKQYIFVDNS